MPSRASLAFGTAAERKEMNSPPHNPHPNPRSTNPDDFYNPLTKRYDLSYRIIPDNPTGLTAPKDWPIARAAVYEGVGMGFVRWYRNNGGGDDSDYDTDPEDAIGGANYEERMGNGGFEAVAVGESAQQPGPATNGAGVATPEQGEGGESGGSGGSGGSSPAKNDEVGGAWGPKKLSGGQKKRARAKRNQEKYIV